MIRIVFQLSSSKLPFFVVYSWSAIEDLMGSVDHLLSAGREFLGGVAAFIMTFRRRDSISAAIDDANSKHQSHFK